VVSPDEQRLISKLKKRDCRAFEQLVNRFQKQVFNFIYRMLGTREEARDLAQEVFISIFKNIEGFRGDSSLATWVYRIASNHCKNRRKYLGRRNIEQPMSPENENTRPASEHIPVAMGVSRPDDLVEGYQTEFMIQQAIAQLEEEQRIILVLRDIQNVSYEDISEITGLPLGTVKSRLHRARMTLKDKLAPYLRAK
jgi:RNA polymerase sigma-70 factor, ECF subfamily